MKRTAYVIEGQAFKRPASLPDGFTVKEVEAEDPQQVEVACYVGGARRFRVEPPNYDNNTVRFAVVDNRGVDEGVWINHDSARQVRDCLNAILGEDKPKRRVFRGTKDVHPWGWYEAEPGLFTYEQSWADAQRAAATNVEGGCRNALLKQARKDSNYGKLIDVTDEYPEVSE